jgi:trehalose 6-phosphate phosphatase
VLPPPPLPVAGERWALLLDVDGSLLDFVDDPAAVVIPPRLREMLAGLHLALDGALALISGRQLEELCRLFGDPPWTLIGLHGLQWRDEAGRVHAAPVEPAQLHRMRQETAALARRLGATWEDKRIAAALHCRHAPSLLPVLRREAEALIAHLPGYELQPGNLVMEFKPAGMDKGCAVHALLEAPAFAGRRPVYLGDDLTDEHAFAEVNRAHGLSIRVGDRTPSHAHFTLPSPAGAHAWLANVLDTLTKGQPPHGPTTGGKPPHRP